MSLENSQVPFVSVVMPVRNEGAFIARSLGAVLAQDYPAERMEVIVADGMSTDASRSIVAALQKSHTRLQLIDNPGKTAPFALNAALRVAHGEVVVRVDGHCVIAHDYVSRCVHHLKQDRVDGVGGPLETIGETAESQVIAQAMSSVFGVGDSAFRTTSGVTRLVDSVAFPAYKRSTLDRVGPFDEELVRNQDDEYNYRLRKLGGSVLLAADVRARYYSRSSFSSLWRQFYQYGFWKVRVLQKHPKQMRARQFVPPLFVATLLTSGAAALVLRPGLWMFLACAMAYAAANLTASTLTVRSGDWRTLPALSAAFAAMHVGYGMGFLVGLFRFWKHWGPIAPSLSGTAGPIEGGA